MYLKNKKSLRLQMVCNRRGGANQKGFTLVELLAIVIILIVIALITYPSIMRIVKKAEKKSFEASVTNILRMSEYLGAIGDVNLVEGIYARKVDVDNNNYYGKALLKNEKMYAEYIGNDKYCAIGYYGALKVYEDSCAKYDETPPIDLEIINNKITTNRIDVTFKAIDYESGIKSYVYCIAKENEECNNYQESKDAHVVFDILDDNTVYNIKAKAKNNNNIESKEKIFIYKTNILPEPVCAVTTDYEKGEKILTCNFKKGDGLAYYYSLNEERACIDKTTSCIEATTDNKEYWSEINQEKILTRRFKEATKVYVGISDGNNSQNVNIEVDAPYDGVDNKDYTKGEEINYEDEEFLVVDSDEETVTLITKNNVGIGMYGIDNTWNTSDAKRYVNETWVNNKTKIKQEIERGGIVYNNETDSYVRLIKKEELVNTLVNGSGTNFWTMTSNGVNIWYSLSNTSTSYEKYATTNNNGTCYNGHSTDLSAITRNYTNHTLTVSNVNTIADTAATVATSGYTKTNTTTSCYSTYSSNSDYSCRPCQSCQEVCIKSNCGPSCSTVCGLPPNCYSCGGGCDANGCWGDATCSEHCTERCDISCHNECTESNCCSTYTLYIASGNEINYNNYSVSEKNSPMGYRAVITVRKRV